MKKTFKLLLLTFILALCVAVSALFYFSYLRYEEAIEALPINDVRLSLKESVNNYVDYEDISPYLLKATVAIEDRRFYEREGFDFIAFGRAMIHNITSLSLSQGGSTIPQQLAKIVYFNYEVSLERKVAEIFLMYDFESAYTKDEILEMYVNIINYGDGNIGIYNARMNYFQKEPEDLDLYESTLLAAIPQSPSYYQLSNHNEATVERQKKVLNDMLEEEMITSEMYEECIKEIEYAQQGYQ